mmetsp:Transcript_82740/g.146094  ORF Transcript_82740/g.146094 Transcript_82740/m.146094 type:complete len:305 (-) Transcript_82740:38-952(-)|eukprot:CAMPEP_0197704808 /NCGR_PEP_ID=MMETSP1338-20131121/126126_1 /TAXON_ID=43686 ORGANISM="Pelagodinium beii, Strain RCC1491" /NCGR_SAMPLE_ID=MMETSP1338 /ASSEMBLY_ACC=CAM_ASM_000754 /LENGTH=304 /DNA_ID=CAMNT_0043288711 /DNA_START=51 /DNA_END=965 /DNA_ORIENTATION=-
MFTVRALNVRLEHATEVPSWSQYLPQNVQAVLRDRFRADEDFAQPQHFVAKSPEHALAPRALPAFPDAPKRWWFQQVWNLARDSQGCRDLQRALDDASCEEERAAIASELQGHVCEAIRCPHANFVMQKLISVLQPTHVVFIFEELWLRGRESISNVARHKYGCRIIQRLLETRLPKLVSILIDHLLDDSISTCQHPYGNYVMQQTMDHCSSSQRRKLLEVLGEHAAFIVPDFHISAVYVKAFAAATRDEQAKLARSLIKAPAMLQKIGSTRHGHQAARHVFKALSGWEQEQAKSLIFGKARAY